MEWSFVLVILIGSIPKLLKKKLLDKITVTEYFILFTICMSIMTFGLFLYEFLTKNTFPYINQTNRSVTIQKILVNIFDDEEYVNLLDLIDQRGSFLNVEVRCEGHTDDLKLPKKAAFPSNWELSSARSLNLVRLLSKYSGIAESNFSALGYGEFRPIINIDNLGNNAQKAEARAVNRRVEIYLDAFLKQMVNGDIQ